MAFDQKFWDHVDDELRENEHIMATKVRKKRNFNAEARPERSVNQPAEVHQDPELWAAYQEYRRTH